MGGPESVSDKDGAGAVADYTAGTKSHQWANYDREQTVTGTPAYDAIKLKKIDDYTSESTLSHAGMVFGTARRVISLDGSTMTITFERKTPADTVRNVAVYRRVPD